MDSCEEEESKEVFTQELYNNNVELNERCQDNGPSIEDMGSICFRTEKRNHDKCLPLPTACLLGLGLSLGLTLCIFTLIISIILMIDIPVIDSIVQDALNMRCAIPNNYFVWEATRPETDCNKCKDVFEVLVFHNLTRKRFDKYAYSPRPMIAKGAALHWSAMHVFSFDYFKDLYNKFEGAYESVEEECQILTFKSDFNSLEEVFAMPTARVALSDGEKPWYVGWSNCHPDVLAEMRSHYTTPEFFPEDAEIGRSDFIFLGYQQGAIMHLDYISRLMWQAQLQGHKTWRVVPPPECEQICHNMTFRVDPGDIVLLDTRQWYHDTVIDPGEMSLSVSSEYG